MSINGKCLCGAVRITASAPPIAARTCWCRNCQFIAAGSSTVNACFRKEDITITGPLKDFPITADSGNILHWRFCPTCGTQVSSEAEVRPHLIFIRTGTLDDPSLAAPHATIWTNSAPGWACINESLPKYPGQAPPVA
jgi:hypothetical protein